MFAAATRPLIVPKIERANDTTPFAWRQIVEPAEPFLDAVSVRLQQQIKEFDAGIGSYAEYALTGQGKQLRPLLVALSAKAAGKLGDDHVTVAVIIEMVHLATLVHDDVMDEAEIRRGRRTLAANWGNETAVLLGDCLFAHALNLAASFPTPEICRAVASATNTVCSGEILQTRQRGNFNLTLSDYLKVLDMKTAELFSLSCDLGACLGGAPAVRRKALHGFGAALGTAYQMYDDCVDIFGSETTAGKSLGTDLLKGKLTLPVLLLRDRASTAERQKLEALIKNWQPGLLSQLQVMLARHDILHESVGMIQRQLGAAQEFVQTLPEGRESLTALTEYLTHQTETICA